MGGGFSRLSRRPGVPQVFATRSAPDCAEQITTDGTSSGTLPYIDESQMKLEPKLLRALAPDIPVKPTA